MESDMNTYCIDCPEESIANISSLEFKSFVKKKGQVKLNLDLTAIQRGHKKIKNIQYDCQMTSP